MDLGKGRDWRRNDVGAPHFLTNETKKVKVLQDVVGWGGLLTQGNRSCQHLAGKVLRLGGWKGIPRAEPRGE